MKCSCRVQWDGGMRRNEPDLVSGWDGAKAGAPIEEELA